MIKGGKGTFDASTITGTFSFYGFSFYFLLFGTPVLSLHFFLCRQSYSTFYVFFFSICYRFCSKGTETGTSGTYIARVRPRHMDVEVDERAALRHLFTRTSSSNVDD
mmetsp:Transcript_37804/g.91993  ORF Transcript_37804/g.91993 Transcript_37804/m.91993 type:complete len:107 (-) Transcript_37804:1343-1663(-)